MPFPIEHKLARIKARGEIGLPLSIYRHRTHPFDPKKSLVVDQHSSAVVAILQFVSSIAQTFRSFFVPRRNFECKDILDFWGMNVEWPKSFPEPGTSYHPHLDIR